jgi:hypothetical protein
MSAERDVLVRGRLLRVLEQCAGYLLPETALHVQVNLELVPPGIRSELTLAIQFLEREGWIIGVRPEMGGPVRWRITELGKSHLAEG